MARNSAQDETSEDRKESKKLYDDRLKEVTAAIRNAGATAPMGGGLPGGAGDGAGAGGDGGKNNR